MSEESGVTIDLVFNSEGAVMEARVTLRFEDEKESVQESFGTDRKVRDYLNNLCQRGILEEAERDGLFEDLDELVWQFARRPRSGLMLEGYYDEWNSDFALTV